MKKIFVVMIICVLLSLSGTLSHGNVVPRERKLILKTKLQPANKKIFGLLLVPCMLPKFEHILKNKFDKEKV